jgi:sterol desaturase/sphingolipid hydroxylase (fatty acid hydroxylase superfamily)
MGNFQQQSQSLAELLRHNLIHLRDMGLVEFLTYLLVGAGVFAMLLHRRRAERFRFLIRAPGPKPTQVTREVYNSALSVVLYNVIQLVGRVIALAFGYVVTLGVHMPLWEELLTFPLVLVVHDAYFYWTHRWMHAPALFRFFHWEHHKSHAPTVFTAYSFSIPEAIVQGLFGIFYVMLFPATFTTLIFFQFVEIIHNLAIHSGMDLFPRALVTGKRFGWLAGPTYHDLHHRTARGNYGLYTRFWDRLCGTEHPDFVKVYDYIHSPQNDGQAYKLLGRRGPAGAETSAPGPEAATDAAPV